jgi:hypothetical protein
MGSAYLHIGWGKCATTWTQGFIFKKVSEIKKIDYNPRESSILLRKLSEEPCHLDIDIEKYSELSSRLRKGNLILSYEGMTGFPDEFINNVKKIKSIVPRETKIILTTRNPRDFLTSMYLQMVSMGHIVKHDEFYYKSRCCEDGCYSAVKRRHNIESFPYQELVECLRKDFNDVYIVPYENIHDERMWNRIFECSVSTTTHKRKIINKSYSVTALNIVFFIERILRKIGVRSYSYIDKIEGGNSEVVKKILNSRNMICNYINCQWIRVLKDRGLKRILLNAFDRMTPRSRYKKFTIDSQFYNTKEIQDAVEYHDKVIDSWRVNDKV